jgi:hypothetical protein
MQWMSVPCACVLIVAAGGTASAQALPVRGTQILSRIPFSFERNDGQFAGHQADWVVHRSGYQILIGSTGASILFASASGPGKIRMQFQGARTAARGEAADPLPGRVSYLIGADPKRWVRDAETFGRVLYHDVYDGVDIAWYGREGQLEYDFVVRPGADTSRIALHFDGARKLALEPAGDLRIDTSAGPLTLRLPAVYQEAGSIRQRVEGHYVLRGGNEVGFVLAGYDKSRPLVIDPKLVYAAWFNSQGVNVTAMATDPQGNIYVGGSASWLPTVSAVQAGDMGFSAPFVIKFDPTGTTMLYATFVGGTYRDTLNGLAVDSTGYAVATGRTESTDFPVLNAAQPACNTPNSAPCGFVFRLNPTGNALAYSTYISAAAGTPAYTAVRTGNAVAVDSAANAYVALDGHVEKLGPDGSVLYNSSVTGGSAITVDQQGFAYLAGSTFLPAFQGVPGARNITGSQCTYNANLVTYTHCTYVARLSTDGTALSWAAMLGSSSDQMPHAIARDPNSGVVYVAGETTATDLPVTAGVIQPAAHGLSDGFLASVSPDGSAFGFVTYLGGMADDRIYAMTLTASGQIVVAGNTFSPDFPLSRAVQPAMGGNGISLYATTDSGATWTAEGGGALGFTHERVRFSGPQQLQHHRGGRLGRRRLTFPHDKRWGFVDQRRSPGAVYGALSKPG